MTLRILAALLLLPLGLSAAPAQPSLTGEQVRAKHREAARKYFADLEHGVKLSGDVEENGSPGTFEAWFAEGKWIVRQQFGDIVATNYDGPEGSWAGSNYSLPYEIDAAGSPASATLNLLTNGKYLDDEYWDKFTYVDDVAGGYDFRFAPDGLPSADVVLYGDSSEPEYLQMMSIEVKLAPTDPDSNVYRSFYYYKTLADGELYTQRETGRQLDSHGETSSFSEFTVNKVEHIDKLPPEASFSFERKPPAPPQISGPVDIPVDVGSGYFIIPVTFPGSDKTWTFIFDSGASVSMFTPEAAAAAGLTPAVKVPAHGHGGRVDFQLGLCKGASLGKADAPADQRVPLSPFPAARVSGSNKDVLDAFESYGVGGILGVAILHQYVATFDNFESKITFIPPDQFKGSDVPRPNLELWLDVEDLIYFTGYISDGVRPEPLRGQVVLDTGLQQKLSVLEETVNANGLQFEKVSSRNNTVLNGVRKFDYVKVPRFDVAVLSWNDVEASLTNDDEGRLSGRGLLGFVGVPFFFGSRVTIDLFNQRMYLRQLSEDEMKTFMDRIKASLGDDAKKDDEPAPESKPAKTEDDGASPSGRSKDDVDRDRFRELDKPKSEPK